MHEHAEQNGGAATVSGGGRIVGSGRMAERTAAYDWANSPLGPVAGWPETLTAVVNSLLSNQHPTMLFWGPQLIQFFNDAAIPIVGPDKFATALGQRADECWAEVWPLVGEQIQQAYRGSPVWKEDQLVPIIREGRIEDTWFTYSYSPARDAQGEIRGVLVTCLETTSRVLAEKQLLEERTQLLKVFDQAPAFFAVLRGPDHIFERVNPKYRQVVGGLDVIGKPVREAIPGIAEQGYIAILDRVFRTGEPYIAADARFTLPPTAEGASRERVVDFVYQPLRDADGSISGILVLGVDMSERKRITDALAETERRAAMVLDSINDGFHMIDAEGRFQAFNQAGREIYRNQGVDADALIGKMAFEVFPEHQRTATGDAILYSLRNRRPSVIESYYAPWDKWFWLRNYPTSDGGLVTFFQDITEKKRTERQLDEQRERFAFATQAARIGYWFCNLPFDKLIWDDTVKEHFWLPPDAEVTLEDFLALLHPDDREATAHAIQESIDNHALYDIEYRTMSPDGRFKWIHAVGRTAYAADGRPLRFDGVTQDVTELRTARLALEAERGRLAAIFDNLPIGILFTSADGRLMAANAQAEHMLGRAVTGGQMQVDRDLLLFHADGRPVDDADRPLRHALSEGGIHRGEYLYRRPDGNTVWLEIVAAPILDAQGQVVGAIDALADIDVRKRAEHALVRNEKLALVGRLAASISHEINNPLESVINLLYLIENNAGNDRIREFSRKAQEELARVAHIVTHTLRFNRQSLGWGEQTMSTLLESSVAIYEGRLKTSGIHLVREYEDATRVRCSGSEVRQVFANVIGNAFDATRSGGKLVLRCRDQRHPRSGEPGVRVSIADSGHGIPSSVRDHLFEPFFTTKGDNGTGLGLWVSREILVKHHAEVRVISRTEPGRSGTVFSMWFPA